MSQIPKYLLSSGALEIHKKLQSISGEKVLDVATESGEFIITLMKMLKYYKSFIGIDISKEKWDLKNFENKPVEFVLMNAEKLEFDDNTFDLVTISHSLHHLANIEKVLTEMKRVLKSGGTFILQEMYSDGNQTKAQIVDILTHHWNAEIDSILGISHNSTLKKQDLKDIVISLGLKDLEVFESSHPVKCLYCDDKFECANPKHKSVIKYSLKEIDEAQNRLNEHLKKGGLTDDLTIRKLREEGKRLKELTLKDGSAPASHLFFVGRKN